MQQKQWQPDWSKYPEWVKFLVKVESETFFVYCFEDEPNKDGSWKSGLWNREQEENPENIKIIKRPSS